MSDPRLTPDAARITRNDAAQVAVAVADLCRTPDGPRDRQLLLGAQVTVLDDQNGWSYVQATRDGYCGFVKSIVLTKPSVPTHKVCVPATHSYLCDDMKSPDRMRISFGAHVTVTSKAGKFLETPGGFIPRQHLTPVDVFADDPAAIATLFLGTPYLWGGNSRDGIDCSGLVQSAFHACGIDCPGDSDLQARDLGMALPQDTQVQRNDLLFWKGHVAIVCDPHTLIHANAHHMAVAYEPVSDAISRIKAQGDGPVTAHRRRA